MTLRTFAIFIYIFFATKQVCHLCRCTAGAAPCDPVSTFSLSCLHLFYTSLPPPSCLRYRLFPTCITTETIPVFVVQGPPLRAKHHCTATVSRAADGRHTLRTAPVIHAADGRRTLSVTCTTGDNGHTNAATIHRKPPALMRFTASNIFDNYPPPHATENSTKGPFSTFLHKKANIPHRRFILFAYLCTHYCACGGTGRRARLRI